MKYLLLVEDDKSLGYILKEYLELRDFKVDWSESGEDGLVMFCQNKYDLCILDVMMPKKDGFTLGAEIKKQDSDCPLIFLTARSLKIDKLKGFKIGCDDYIVKPVDEEELIARINAVLRRTENRSDNTRGDFQIGKYSFDPKNQKLRIGKELRTLTEKESQLLNILCMDIGNLVDRKEILNTLWGTNDYFNRRSMDVFISKLRKHFRDDSSVRISNVHGKGFVLEVSG